MRRRRRRLVVATTTTVLACLSTVTTSLSQFMFTTLPFTAQKLQVASNYVSWRQVERLQLIYNYSCQAGDYYRSYYRTTLELYHNMTTTPKQRGEVIDVEQTTTPATSLPPLKAPTVAPLGDWRMVKGYLLDSKALSGRFRTSCLERSDLTSGLLHSAMSWSSQKPSQQPCARIKSLVWLGNACIGLLSSDAYVFAQSKSESWRTRQASPSLCLSLPTYVLGQASVLHVRLWTTAPLSVGSSLKLRASFLAKAGCIHALA